MSTVQEIKTAIESLSPAAREELERLLRPPAAPAGNAPLPDYAERRRRIFGDRVLPNLVIEARKLERT